MIVVSGSETSYVKSDECERDGDIQINYSATESGRPLCGRKVDSNMG